MIHIKKNGKYQKLWYIFKKLEFCNLYFNKNINSIDSNGTTIKKFRILIEPILLIFQDHNLHLEIT